MRPTAAVPVLALLAAGCNPFLENYRGERFAPVESARVVKEAPPEAEARPIGESAFRSSDLALDDRHVADAARALGADLATWDATWDGKETTVEAQPIYQRGVADRGTFATYVAVPRTRDAWQFKARFFRSLRAPGLGSRAPVPSPAPAGTPLPGPPQAPMPRDRP
jgi:hypothetical protein